jgi:K+-transporting ATPase ATPase C chain
VFRENANGSLVREDGEIAGSSLLGRTFEGPGYFALRPSAAGDGYDAAASSASNLGPSSPKLIHQVERRAAEYREREDLAPSDAVPADAVTASASGLDPAISVANAELQAPRVARERGLTEDEVTALIDEYTESPALGFLGEERVNATLLNLALDRSG